MDIKKFLIGTFAGGITFFLLGFVTYAILLEDFFMAHAGTATGVMKTDEMQYWPLFLGNLSQAALLSYVFLKWANIKTFGGGMSAGAIIGFLTTLGHTMISYDTSNVMDMTAAFVDPFVYAIISAIAGGVVAVVIGMGQKE
jgi:hypothetical protein